MKVQFYPSSKAERMLNKPDRISCCACVFVCVCWNDLRVSRVKPEAQKIESLYLIIETWFKTNRHLASVSVRV